MKPSTIKKLYGRSGNQCAHPECTNLLIAPVTEESEAAVLSHICHIYARSDQGPRGKPNLSPDERDSIDNLILLCPNHHETVDKQPEKYPADTLKHWKRMHEAKVDERMRSDYITPAIPTVFIDKQIASAVNRFRKRFAFGNPDGIDAALSLASQLADGFYSSGSDSIRMAGLARCVRVIAAEGDFDNAEKLLAAAALIGSCAETSIARAIVLSRRGEKRRALRDLAPINTPASRSAGFGIMEWHDGLQGAIEWLRASNISVADVDYDGKLLLLGRQLEQDRWSDAFACLGAITDDDLREAPALHYFVGLTNLLKAVPENHRRSVFRHVPIDGKRFPLASTRDGVESLRTAHQHFMRASDAARQLDCFEAAAEADEYSLWLGLRFSDLETDVQNRLKESLNGPPARLRFVSPAVHFGIELDFAAVERQIAQTVARYGGATYDSALARFAIMSAQGTPALILEYLDNYQEEMVEIIEGRALTAIRIEMLSKVGRTSEAKELMDELASNDGLSPDLDRLRSCIAESEGAGPVDIRRRRFDRTKDLEDLSLLVESLVTTKRWDDVYCGVVASAIG